METETLGSHTEERPPVDRVRRWSPANQGEKSQKKPNLWNLDLGFQPSEL